MPKFQKKKSIGRDVSIVHDNAESFVLRNIDQEHSKRAWKVLLNVSAANGGVVEDNCIQFPMERLSSLVVRPALLIAIVFPVYYGQRKIQIVPNFEWVLSAWNERRSDVLVAESEIKDREEATMRSVLRPVEKGTPSTESETSVDLPTKRVVRRTAKIAMKGFPKCSVPENEEPHHASTHPAELRAETNCIMFEELSIDRRNEFVSAGGHCSAMGCCLTPDVSEDEAGANFWFCQSCFRGFCIEHDDYLNHVSGMCFDCNSK